MASEQDNEGTNGVESQSANGHSIAKAAAIAAASGATAYAARKVFESRSSGESNGSEKSQKSGAAAGGSGALIGAAVTSGWDVAKDSLLPVVEDAATRAGSFLAERAPEVVRDVVVPRFIEGFEGARGRSRESGKQPTG